MTVRPLLRLLVAAAISLLLAGAIRAQATDPLRAKVEQAAAAHGRGDYGKAEKLCEEVIASKGTQRDGTLGWAFLQLGLTCFETGRYQEGLDRVRRSLDVYNAVNDSPLSRAAVLNALGRLLTDVGQYKEAAANLAQSRAILEGNPNNPRTEKRRKSELLQVRFNQARLARMRGEYDSAEAILKELITSSGEAGDSLLKGKTHNALGNVYAEWGKSESGRDGGKVTRALYAKAEDQYRTALGVWQAEKQKEAARIPALVGEGATRSNAAWYYQLQERFADAKRQYELADGLLAEAFPKPNLQTAQVQSNLGWLHYLDGEYGKAEELFHKSLDTRTKTLQGDAPAPPDHPDLNLSRYNLALARAAQEKLTAAAELMDQARRSTRTFLAAELAGMGDAAQLDVVKRQRDDWHAVLSLGVADPRLAELSAAWVLNHKGFTLELGTNRAAAGAAKGWVELDAVRDALVPGTVLVEIARFGNWELKPRGVQKPEESPRYVAWLIPARGEGKVVAVPLGDPTNPKSGKQIDDAVEAARKELDGTPDRLAAGPEHRAEKQAAAVLATLSRLVLDPIRKHVRKDNHLILSPDAALGKVPWAALPLTDAPPNGTRNNVTYAVEHYLISYVTSGRDLVRAAAVARPGRSVVFADLDYGVAPGPSVQIPMDKKSVSVDPFKRLKASAEEGRVVSGLLKGYTGGEPAQVTGKAGRVKELLGVKRPRVLFVSTHGYSIEPEADEVTREPLKRTGLVMSGGNLSTANFATGEQIREMDLVGTELVMLSACETARGKVVDDAQGTRSLQQAFHLAGARTVVATQWSVPDLETADVMKVFFQGLAAKRGKAAALREAQLAVLAAHRTDVNVAHPFFWGAFTLSGDWR